MGSGSNRMFPHLCLILLISSHLVESSTTEETKELKWWQSGVIYQVYPRSFKDDDNDGIGDLAGVRKSLPYLQDLGVTGVWLSPIYPSPMKDFGYDISNFTDVDPVYGTLDDFDQLVKEAGKLGMRVIMDLVPNHSSDEHPWFLKSVRREPGYEDYYVWRDPKGTNPDGTPIPPNNWLSNFYGSGWEYNKERKQFYFHQFAKEQPDLNFRNPAVVQEMKDVISFWMTRGVHGFRIDAIWTLFEHKDELDEPIRRGGASDPNDPEHLDHPYTKDQPETYDMVRQWRQLVDDQSAIDHIDRCIMVEMYGDIHLTMDYFGTREQPSAHFPFNFQLIPVKNTTGARDIENMIHHWVDNVPGWGWSNWLLGNHDNHRIGSRIGADFIDGMNMLIMTLPGTAITYNGEEIGMVDNLAITYEEGIDPNGKNFPPAHWYIKGRDFERTPFQWNDSVNAGFNDGAPPWLPVHENYKQVNMKAQKDDPKSHYNIYKELVKEIRPLPALRNGFLRTTVLGKNTLAVFRYVDLSDCVVTLINFGQNEDIIDLTGFLSKEDKAILTVLVASKSFKKEKLDKVNASKIHLPGRSSAVLRHFVSGET